MFEALLSVRNSNRLLGRPAPASNPRAEGFTLIELLVVIAIIVILASLLLPSLSRAKDRALTAACMNHLKQLQICYHLYAVDHQGVLPPNNFVYDVGSGGPALGFSDTLTWCPGNTRIDNTPTNIQRGLLFPYNQTVGLYRCPSDRSTIETPDGQALNQPRTRSYSMSQSVNGLPIDFPNVRYPPSYQKDFEILDPSPSDLFVFLDVHEGGIIDSLFGIPPPGWTGFDDIWWDLPANRHSRGCSFSFADGHVERWKWVTPKIFVKVGQPVSNLRDREDFRRLRSRVKPETRP